MSNTHLLSVQRIWDDALCSAFTDLLYFQGQWLCVFRESDAHQHGRNGTIRLIASIDGKQWVSIASFSEEGVDLRDPKLSEMPDGRLMLLAGGTVYEGSRYVTRQPRAAFSMEGRKWTPFHPILSPHDWLWRITWHEGIAYGASYRMSNPKRKKGKWIITLFKSANGLDYHSVKQWPISHYPNETTLRFLQTGEMVALVRRERHRRASALIGVSKPPFTSWRWESSGYYFGGPNFLVLEDGSMWACGRLLVRSPYCVRASTVLAKMTLNNLHPVLVLPSGGDTSYPGMVYRGGELWVSYYSSHEKKTAVYLARVSLA